MEEVVCQGRRLADGPGLEGRKQVYQPAVNAARLRRCNKVAKPAPPEPTSIMTQVEGSGTLD